MALLGQVMVSSFVAKRELSQIKSMKNWYQNALKNGE
jgi:hypothetical protein